jgi:SAM-dependent methyltransferase/glycosyltransferase involved in cell wall biosynthesis
VGDRVLSLVIPTRGRPDQLRALFASIEAQTARLDRLEIVLVVDDDDPSYETISLADVRVERVVVPAGLRMGELNMAGYERCTGSYIMLLNDDVILRTRAWDERILEVFQSFPDGIVLVHVNDGIYGEKLCTFPFVSRKFCELADGICPREYRRYRIDDHIYNIFNLLSVLGHNRLIYLPEVLFEHHNFIRTASGVEYRPDETIHAIDTRLFDDLLEQRKAVAVRLARAIDDRRALAADAARRELLAPITDSVALRRREFIREWRPNSPLSSLTTRVTVGIVTADLRAAHAKACVKALKRYTQNIDLIIVDNGRTRDFNHSREMNRILASCRTDYIVLMDDDVIVEAGWLDGLLRCVTPTVGVVTPLHKGPDGRLSYAGVVMRPDYSGHHGHGLAVFEQPFRIQTLCSAIVLIDVAKCGHLRWDERYRKYFLDIDYGLRVWESGFEVVCSPYVIVTHIGGATLRQGGEESNRLFEEQRRQFVSAWIETGRYASLEEGRWRGVPELEAILSVPKRLERLLVRPAASAREEFVEEAHRLFDYLKEYPLLRDWAAERLWATVGERRPSVDDPDDWHLAYLLGQIDHPVLVAANRRGLNVVLWNGRYYAIPTDEGAFDATRFERGGYSRGYEAERVRLIDALIAADVREEAGVVPSGARHDGTMPSAIVPRLLEEGYKGFNLVGYDRVYGLLQGDGPFEMERVLRSDYTVLYTGETTEDVKRLIDTQPLLVRFRIFLKRRRRLARMLRRAAEMLGGSSAAKVSMGPESTSGSLGTAAKKAVGCASRWARSSPITRVIADFQGFAIYRYEFKYFAIPTRAGEFDYRRYREGAYENALYAHSIGEVKTLIEQRAVCKDAAGRMLVFCPLPRAKMQPLLESLTTGEVELLCARGAARDYAEARAIEVDEGDLGAWAREVAGGDPRGWARQLATRGYKKIVVPWCFPETWRDNAFEVAASRIVPHLEVIHARGQRRWFYGEKLHRLVYNKAYLASMFEVVPLPTGATVLEVGCSDGLICDVLGLLGAGRVVGVDVMTTVGCGFQGKNLDYCVMDATTLGFPAESFDVVVSIATLEHVGEPRRALEEMLRVLKRGGYGYVQAGPLFHSPFGHHMFAYFQEEPWIHLRKTKEEIVEYAAARGIDSVIERDLGLSAREYVEGMLNADHLNGLALADYGLAEFRSRSDIEILKYNISYEGRDLLSPVMLRELGGFDPERLVEHGFEIAFRKRR